MGLNEEDRLLYTESEFSYCISKHSEKSDRKMYSVLGQTAEDNPAGFPFVISLIIQFYPSVIFVFCFLSDNCFL